MDDTLEQYLSLAQQLENASEHAARNDQINRREQLYNLDWIVQKDELLEYAVDVMPKVVADRAEDKICAQDYTLSCFVNVEDFVNRSDPRLAFDPQAQKQALEQAKLTARKRSDEVEATVRGVLEKIQKQQGVNVVRGMTHNAVVAGFAGVVRIGYDESALVEPGVIPIFVNLLDPRCYYEIPASGAANGPQVVVYKRYARRQYLEHEGWPLGELELDRVGRDTMVTVWDVWEKKRTKKGISLMNGIILDGGEHCREWLKKPVDMAKLGLTRIPYVCVPVRPSPYRHEEYPHHFSNAFIDIFDNNWELRNKVLSWQAQLVAKSINPPTVVKSRRPIDVDAVTPGAQNDVDPGEDITTLLPSQPMREVAQTWSMLEQMTQRGTFAAASFGEGAQQMSGLMTGRLQQASEEGLGATKEAVEDAAAQVFGLVAMFAKLYLSSEHSVVIPIKRGEQAILNTQLLRGNESFKVHLPGQTSAEMAQTAANWRQLAQPWPDGTRWISNETAREMSGVIPFEHIEEERMQRENWDVMVMEGIRAGRAKRQVEREENVLDMQARAGAEQQLAAGGPRPLAPGAPGPGVPQTPMQTPVGAQSPATMPAMPMQSPEQPQ